MERFLEVLSAKFVQKRKPCLFGLECWGVFIRNAPLPNFLLKNSNLVYEIKNLIKNSHFMWDLTTKT